MDKTYLGRSIAEFSPGIASQPITKVELLDENGDIIGQAGTDGGKVLTAVNPDGTNEMAQHILSKVSGYAHLGYDGSDALLDPAAELGDGMTVSGVYVPLIAQDVTFDALLAQDISAPDADEIDDEYPYKSSTQRQIERNMAKTRSLITKTSEEIMLKVEGIDGKYTEVKTTLDGLTVSDASGTTKIKGSSIETSTLYVDAANISGKLTANQIQASSISVGDLKDGSSYATKTYVDNNAGLSASEVNSAIATYIDDTSITAEKLRGRYIDLLASTDTTVGSIEIAYTTTGIGLGISTQYGGIQIQSAGNLFLSSGTGGAITLQNSRVVLSGALCLGGVSYGTSAPTGSGAAGQLYVQLVS